MAKHLLEVVFYDCKEPKAFPVDSEGYHSLVEAAKRLALGERDVPGYFILGVTEQIGMLVSIKEIQALHCVELGNGGDLSKRDGVTGMEFYLRGREEPVSIELDPKGPISDMLYAMAESNYDDAPEGCVMMTDVGGNPFFFVPDDIQCIVMDRVYLEGLGLAPD